MKIVRYFLLNKNIFQKIVYFLLKNKKLRTGNKENGFAKNALQV